HDRVTCDPVPAALHRERLRQPENPGLRRRIAGLTETAERACNRGHVHDPAPTTLFHVWPYRLRAVEPPGEVDAEVPLPELWTLVMELSHVVERPGVVDQDVDGAQLSDRPRDCRPHLLAIRYVTSHGERAAPKRADLVDRLLRVHHALCARHSGERTPTVGLLGELGLDEDVGNRDVGSGMRERQRVGAPEPARATGHESHTARKVDRESHDPGP